MAFIVIVVNCFEDIAQWNQRQPLLQLNLDQQLNKIAERAAKYNYGSKHLVRLHSTPSG